MPKLSHSCSFGDCERIIAARGLCAAHYQQKRNGRPLAPLRQYRKGPESPAICQFVDCPRVAKSRDLCSTHYQQMLRQGYCEPIVDRRQIALERRLHEAHSLLAKHRPGLLADPSI